MDHDSDPGSAERAAAAEAIATGLEIPFQTRRRTVSDLRRSGESFEMAARRIRYRVLGAAADTHGARYIATAHHLDDQAETVLLRLARNQDWPALAAIPERRGRIVRPLLGVERRALERVVAKAGTRPVEDPANEDPAFARNRVRSLLLPALAGGSKVRSDEPVRELNHALAALAARAASASRSLARRLERRLEPRVEADGVSVSLAALRDLPRPLRRHALVFLVRLVWQVRRDGAGHQPSARALEVAERALAAGSPLGIDLGGLRAECHRGRFWIRTSSAIPAMPMPPFAYTVEAPGETVLEAVSLVLSVRRGAVRPWMFRGSKRRVAFSARIPEDGRLVVRNRRPGDRIQPLGSNYSRRLKEILIDRKIPRDQRARLPLLCLGDDIVWVPGVTVNERVRLRRDSTEAWIAELRPLHEFSERTSSTPS